jgi:hypothetical protein
MDDALKRISTNSSLGDNSGGIDKGSVDGVDETIDSRASMAAIVAGKLAGALIERRLQNIIHQSQIFVLASKRWRSSEVQTRPGTPCVPTRLD